MTDREFFARAERAMQRELEQPNSIDAAVDHYVKVAKTQAAIIEHIKEMAKTLAAAAIASEKAVGDRPSTAISKWTRILADEANRLVREQQAPITKTLTDGKTIDQELA